MDVLTFHLENVNWTAIVVATLASFVLGSVWYAKPFLGARWMKLVGLKDKDVKGANMPMIFALTGLLSFAMATGLATLMGALEATTTLQGAFLGILVGLVFLGANRGVHGLFERKGGVELYIINLGYDLAYFAIAGAIIGAF